MSNWITSKEYIAIGGDEVATKALMVLSITLRNTATLDEYDLYRVIDDISAYTYWATAILNKEFMEYVYNNGLAEDYEDVIRTHYMIPYYDSFSNKLMATWREAN